MPKRPEPTEHATYYSRYIDLVQGDDVLGALTSQIDESLALLASVPADREEYRYAPEKWSVRQVVGHLIDTERVFGFRCLWVARGAPDDQPSMDQEAWAAQGNAGDRPLAELTAEWAHLRADLLTMFRSFDDAAWARIGSAGGNPFTARTFPWIIAGHELYHRALLRRDYGIGGGA